MQTLGTKAVHPAIEDIAERSSRPEVGLWLERALKKVLKRPPSPCLRKAETENAIKVAMKADGVPVHARGRIMTMFRDGDEFHVPDKRGVARLLSKAVEVLDWFDSMPDTDRHIKRIERISWGEAIAASDEWHRRLAAQEAFDVEITAGDLKTLHEFSDGCRVVELLSKNALKVEGGKMGHCVGGYWRMVAEGHTRIISLRDPDNRPHVTIELRRPPSLHVEGLGTIFVNSRPYQGVQKVTEINGDWRAVQIRGKQNALPVARWAGKASEFLRASGIVSTEGISRASADPRQQLKVMTVYTVGRRSFIDPDVAADHSEAEVYRRAERSLKFTGAYQSSGLMSIHAHVKDPARVVNFLSEDREIETVDEPLIPVPGAEIKVFRHRTPLRPILAVARNVRPDAFPVVAATIRPALEVLLTEMEKAPGHVHVCGDHDGLLSGTEIKSAFLMAGLAKEFTEFSEMNAAVLKTKVKEARLVVKRARQGRTVSQEDINRFSNLLSDGFEQRIEEYVRQDLGLVTAFSVAGNKDSNDMNPSKLGLR